MLYRCLAGPQIKVGFYTKSRTILKIVLSHSLQKGAEWEVFGSFDALLEKKICRWMEDYCQKKIAVCSLPFTIENAASFLKKTLMAVSTIPFGKYMSYKELASSIQNPRAARAVGNACAHNPLPLLIPCHRILATSQDLGGFFGGLSLKEKLLEHESIFFKR